MSDPLSLQKNKMAVALFARLMRFSAWLQDLPNRISPAPFRLLQVGSAFWQSRVLYTAARLDIAGVIADGTMSAEDIATEVGAQPDAIKRLLRFLTAKGIFEQVGLQRFRNNKVSACLREDHPQSMRAMVLMHNSHEMSLPWYEQLETGIKTGEVPFKLAHREELFPYMSRHADFGELFNTAMESVEALSGDYYAIDFDWSPFTRVFDLGGGIGSKAVTLLRHHPQLHAEVIDAGSVTQGASAYWQKKIDDKLLQRLTFTAGDVLDSVPAAKDAKDIYFLSAVLHGLDDASCIKVLANIARASTGTGARTAVLELVVDADRPDAMSTAFDMQMFMGTRGRERTLGDWQKLIDQSNMRLDQVVGLRGFGTVLVMLPLH